MPTTTATTTTTVISWMYSCSRGTTRKVKQSYKPEFKSSWLSFYFIKEEHPIKENRLLKEASTWKECSWQGAMYLRTFIRQSIWKRISKWRSEFGGAPNLENKFRSGVPNLETNFEVEFQIWDEFRSGSEVAQQFSNFVIWLRKNLERTSKWLQSGTMIFELCDMA